MYDTVSMTGREFVARARSHAKKHGLTFNWDARRGKGSHGSLSVGNHSTTVKYGPIGKGLLVKMLKQLDIPREEF